MNWHKKIKKCNDKGFSLVELVIVVAVIAILVGILAPQYVKYVERSRKTADVQNLKHLVESFKVVILESPRTNGGKGDTLFKPGYTYGFTMNTSKSKATQFIKSSKPEKIEDYEKSVGSFSQVSYVGDEAKKMEEIFGKNWKTTALKSSKWVTKSQNQGRDHYIWVLCYLNEDESLEITYCTYVQDYMEKFTED